MRVLVTGATGFIGSHLVPFLKENGYVVQRITRKPSQADDIAWDPARQEIDAAAVQPPEAVAHLAGENIADGRWTDAKKQHIRESRVKGTQLLSDMLARLPHRPRVFVSASAVGYYGNRANDILTEESGSGEGFLAEVCRQWEAATQPAIYAGIRTVHLRNGLVLSADGGALSKLLLPFNFGLGGPLGSGQQYWSWISMTDWLRIILHCFTTEMLSGPVNAVAPHPVTNAEFTQTLGSILKRPTLVPIPEFAARFALGEMADEMLFASTRVLPVKLHASDYHFTHETLDVALQDALHRTER
jgi:uncharacterized protein (TIGR01777 family)